jgi:hypothetical protein
MKGSVKMTTQQWIMVMSKVPSQEEFGMDVSYSVDVLGAKLAMEKAQSYIEEQSKIFRDAEFKLQGGEW